MNLKDKITELENERNRIIAEANDRANQFQMLTAQFNQQQAEAQERLQQITGGLTLARELQAAPQ